MERTHNRNLMDYLTAPEQKGVTQKEVDDKYKYKQAEIN